MCVLVAVRVAPFGFRIAMPSLRRSQHVIPESGMATGITVLLHLSPYGFHQIHSISLFDIRRVICSTSERLPIHSTSSGSQIIILIALILAVQPFLLVYTISGSQ